MHVFQSKVRHYVLLHVSSLWSGVFSVSQLDGLMFENEEIETAIKINIGQIVQRKKIKTVNFSPNHAALLFQKCLIFGGFLTS